MKVVLSNIKPGASVLEVAKLGDKTIVEYAAKYAKKNVASGIAFPTCINVNGFVCHYSPLDDDKLILQPNDVVRIDLGAHIDGYIAVVAQTVFLTNEVVRGKAADLLAAAYDAMNASLRLMKVGHKNSELAPVIQKIVDTYGVTLCDGVLGHEMKRYVIDGANCILLKPTSDHTVAEFQFEPNHTYSLDIVLSSGDGKLKEHDSKPTVYKRIPQTLQLKSKTAKETFQVIKSIDLPFSIRDLPNLSRTRLGLVELYNTRLVDRFSVMTSKEGEIVVHLKTTVHVLPSGVQSVTGIPNVQPFQSEIKISDPEILNILNSSLKSNKKKNKKAKNLEDMDTTD